MGAGLDCVLDPDPTHLPHIQGVLELTGGPQGTLRGGNWEPTHLLLLEAASTSLGFPGALPQRRVVWMWCGAFPGAFWLGRAQPQRRGTSP